MPIWQAATALLAVVLALVGCTNAGGTASSATARGTTPDAAPQICIEVARAGRGVRVFVEPDAGEAPILGAIKGARVSVWVEAYLLSDRNVVHALEDATTRGVDVWALLETRPFGGGEVPAQTLEELAAAGVRAKEANPAFQFTHAKVLLVDGTTANREYSVVDTDAADVAEIKAIFEPDWERVVSWCG